MSRGPGIVLDTHAAIWAQLDAKRLSRVARAALGGLPPAAVAVSDVTLGDTCRRYGRIPALARSQIHGCARPEY